MYCRAKGDGRTDEAVLQEARTKIAEVRSLLSEKADGALPIELMTLLNFVEWTAKGKNGRGREVFRNQPQPAVETERRAA